MLVLPYTIAIALILITTAFLRLLYVLPAIYRTKPSPRKCGTSTHLFIVLGSGGHTAEMLSLLTDLDPNIYTHRSYVVSSGDEFSTGRAEDFEEGLVVKKEKRNDVKGSGKGGGHDQNDYTIHTVPRARRIHQSLLTSPLTSLHCLYSCLLLLLKHPHGHPDLILTNGPATSLILILASTILRYFAFLPMLHNPNPGGARDATGKMRVIYVESWARVKRPSLSGRIIVWCGLCDRVLVQWKGLERKGWGEYKGVLVR